MAQAVPRMRAERTFNSSVLEGRLWGRVAIEIAALLAPGTKRFDVDPTRNSSRGENCLLIHFDDLRFLQQARALAIPSFIAYSRRRTAQVQIRAKFGENEGSSRLLQSLTLAILRATWRRAQRSTEGHG